MKKVLQNLIMLMIVLSLMLVGIVVNAETLPVKNAWIFNENCVFVLRENGDLLFGDSIETQKPKLLAQDIIDFRGYCSPLWYFTGYALHKNGDIKIYSSDAIANKEEIEFKTETINANAKEIFYTEGLFAYIDKNQKMKITSRNGNLTVDNAKIICPNCDYDDLYIISTNDTLHKISVGLKEVLLNKDNEIMTNIKECMVTNGGDIIVLRNNGDLYLIKNENAPERIGTGISSMDKVAIHSSFPNYPIDFVNEAGECYSYSVSSSGGSLKKYMDNVRDVYILDGDRYVVTNDNILYSFGPYHWGTDVYKSSTKQTKSVSKIIGGTGDFIIKTDNSLYTNESYNSKYVLDNAKELIFFEGTVSSDDDLYLFIKNNGELYGAYPADDRFYVGKCKTPFITSFCQKATKVIINNKEVELTAKIQMVNDRSMYPFRECLENMGATVLWDSVNQIAIGEYNGIIIEFPIGRSEYWVNGVKYEMDVPSYIDNSIGRTYIPIRYAAEGLGFTVDWIEGDVENIISIHK